MRTDRERLQDIIERCERLLPLVVDRAAFDSQIGISDAVQFNLLIIGEAVTGISPEFKALHSDLPWREIAAMRNRLVHAYFGTSLELVWVAAIEFAPHLEKRAKEILLTLEDAP